MLNILLKLGDEFVTIIWVYCFQLVSNSVWQVIMDVKVGPPSYEKGLAQDILSIVSVLFVPLILHCFIILNLWSKNALLVSDFFLCSFTIVFIENLLPIVYLIIYYILKLVFAFETS